MTDKSNTFFAFNHSGNTETPKWEILLLIFLVFSFVPLQEVSAQKNNDFSKQGTVHSTVLQAWDTHYKDYFASEINRRLLQEGDVYILYDIQIGGLQSFVEMARRCNDTRQISELVDLLSPVLSALEPLSGNDSSRGWICTGGHICTAYNFLGKEVPLCSVQFLGLLGAVATTVMENIPLTQQSGTEKDFVTSTFTAMAVHLNRWLSKGYFASVDSRLQVSSAEWKEGHSGKYFSDKDLWYLTVLSDLSELYQAGVQPAAADGKDAFKNLQRQKKGIGKIFDLFLARTFITTKGKVARAELDKGFWKYHFDNRYANYSDSVSPVSWIMGNGGTAEMKTHIPWDSTYIAHNVGWDISHARRLVPALETFARNRENITEVWGYHSTAFDPVALRGAYANQVVEKIWNGDIDYPLFSNFWSGDNGWYRVAYASQTGRQFIGYPPYGLNTAMPQGGYPVWGAFNPTLNRLFRRIFELSQSDDPAAKAFASKYYPGLYVTAPNPPFKERVPNLSFLSDLVELPIADLTGKESLNGPDN